MSLPAVAHDACCESCGQKLPPKRKAAVQLAQPFEPRPRKGGRQASVGPLVRTLTHFLTERHDYTPKRAERVARLLVTHALPARQRKPRTR